MPYLLTDRKQELENPSVFPDKEGDWNFLFSQAYLNFWNQEGNQRYHNIHKLRVASAYPETILEVKLVEDRLIAEGITLTDRLVARELAFTEFYDRIGSFYERLARMKNGDLEEFKVALKKLEDMVRSFLIETSK